MMVASRSVVYFLPIFAVYLCLIGQLDAYEFDPPSKTIEVVTSDSYIFGIDEFGDTLIEYCYYENDLGLKGYFVVGIDVPNVKNNDAPRLFENVVSHLGKEGLSKVQLDKATVAGPRQWKLSAFDMISDEFINATFSVIFHHRAPILKYNVEITENAGFFNYLKLDGVSLTKCTLKFDDAKLDLDLKKSTRPTLQGNSQTDDTIKRMTSLGGGLCGFQLLNVSWALEKKMKWTLTAMDNDKVLYRESFSTRVNARPPEYNLHYSVKKSLGEKLTINVPFPITASFCTIFNPQGTMVTTDCTYTIRNTGYLHFGNWTCVRADKESLEGITYTVEVIEQVEEIIRQVRKETQDEMKIGCRIDNLRQSSIELCKITSPAYKLFDVKPYQATERYNFIGTDFSSGICSLNIKKPLLSSEQGIWRCEIKIKSDMVKGTVIELGNKVVDYNKNIKLAALVGKPVTILCEVPYYSEHCSIIAPNGTVFETDNANEIPLGKCSHYIKIVNVTDHGTWTCQFARLITGQPDDHVSVQVTVAHRLHHDVRIEADQGDDVHLLCSSGSLALKSCRFVSPSGIGYQIYDRLSDNTARISYYGQGLRYGDCGIKIASVRQDEAGSWTCETQLYDNLQYKEILTESIYVEVEQSVSGRPSSLGSVGIGLLSAAAVVFLAVVTVIFVVRRIRYHRHHQQQSYGTTTTYTANEENDSPRTSTNEAVQIFTSNAISTRS